MVPGPRLHAMISSSWTVAAIWWLRQHFSLSSDDDLWMPSLWHVRHCLRESRRLAQRQKEGRLQPWEDTP